MFPAHLETEFIVVARPGKKVEEAVKPLREKGSHVELVSPQPLPMHTLSQAFNKAHFSQILVSLNITCLVQCCG